MNITIAICDDVDAQVNYLSGLCNKWADMMKITVIIKSFPSSESYLFFTSEDKSTDVLLLDIEMPGMSGMELAKKLRGNGDSVQIIFITGYPDFIAEGYDVAALHYLLKPIDEKKFMEVLSKAAVHIAKDKTVVLLSAEGRVVRLYEEDINYIEASGHGTIAYTTKGQQRLSESISNIAGKLSTAFIPCHRSFIVNLNKVSAISRTGIILDNNREIPLARGKYEAINHSFLIFYKELKQ